MTVGDGEEVELPDELKPISRGGSWFDDVAKDRLKKIHKQLKDTEVARAIKPEMESEEKFILAKLGKGKSHHIHKSHDDNSNKDFLSFEATRVPSLQQAFNIQPIIEDDNQKSSEEIFSAEKEPKFSFAHHHHTAPQKLTVPQKPQSNGPQSNGHSMTTDEFLNNYEKELTNFFRSFMNAMLKAEIHEVRIEERHSNEDSKEHVPHF